MGFAVDMDRAYSDFNSNSKIISKNDKDYKKYNKFKNDFKKLTLKLLDYFEKNNYSKSVTWFVNEADYNISYIYKNILNKCNSEGELGLHTHFNSTKFNATLYSISNNKSDWFNYGLKKPTDRLSNIYNNKINIFKGGNHMRNDAIFDSLSELGYSIDTTYDINGKNIENGVTLYNDTDIELGSEPFFIKCNNGDVILEIPEIRACLVNGIKHIKTCKKKNNVCFVKLQIHHWQYDQLIPIFDKFIEKIKENNFDIEFVSLKEMQKIYFKKILDNTNINLNEFLNNKKNVLNSSHLNLSIYLFNNYSKKKKILELHGGIGETLIFLNKIGFSNLSLFDINKNRNNLSNKITNGNIKLLSDKLSNNKICNYDKINFKNYDIILLGFTYYLESNFIKNEEKLIIILESFINNYNLLIIHIKNLSSNIIKNFVEKIKINSDNYKIDNHIKEYIIISKKKIEIKNFSKCFNIYKLINNKNIIDNIININNTNVIQLKFKEKIDFSAGIYFPLFQKYLNLEEKKYKCKIILELKVTNNEENFELKIYTGVKWISIGKLTNNFKIYTFEGEFDFFYKSIWRIGFEKCENTTLFIKNFDLIIDSI